METPAAAVQSTSSGEAPQAPPGNSREAEQNGRVILEAHPPTNNQDATRAPSKDVVEQARANLPGSNFNIARPPPSVGVDTFDKNEPTTPPTPTEQIRSSRGSFDEPNDWAPRSPIKRSARTKLTERELRFELFHSGRSTEERVSATAMRSMRAADQGLTGVQDRYGVTDQQASTAEDPNLSGTTRSEEEEEKGEAAKLGTVAGVFLPCLQNILGIILFIRLSWIVGQAGIGLSVGIVTMCCCSTFLTGLSLSAIATNGQMKGGGPYFLIGRALGPEVGVSIGLCFYLATTTAASMYILGAVETIYSVLPQLMIYGKESSAALDIRDMQILGTIILSLLAAMVLGGVKHISRVAPFFLVPVLLSVLFIQIGIYLAPSDSAPSGITGLKYSTVRDNFEPEFTNTDAQGNPTADGEMEWSFQALLALFYPSVTGIMAGSNRSASLRDPQSSIPVGTLSAIAVTSTLYMLSVVLYGSVATRDYLLTERLMSAKVSWPAEEVVSLGITLSTLGAGLQSMVGAPRLVAAIANDGILPFLEPLRVAEGQEPTKALFVTATITLCGVLVGNLDLITPIITMFFLLCYMGVNLSCLMLSLINAPSWRPRWRYYHWTLSLLGLLLCLTIMFLISWIFSIIALSLAFLMYHYVSEHGNSDNWGDGIKTLRLNLAIKTLQGLDHNVHPKNWCLLCARQRPTTVRVVSSCSMQSTVGARRLVDLCDEHESIQYEDTPNANAKTCQADACKRPRRPMIPQERNKYSKPLLQNAGILLD
ncbi:Protein ccc1 [Cymbomonas tetramitiformis]|uniref:Protein ccc1 n=1 Tax=Cymbomonas tetramitiformis TaxID=36881 RepID=A0AAE0FW99_9CHLO|nr:Protein ccc1 [Cymbomonas tetramitiformis]